MFRWQQKQHENLSEKFSDVSRIVHMRTPNRQTGLKRENELHGVWFVPEISPTCNVLHQTKRAKNEK